MSEARRSRVLVIGGTSGVGLLIARLLHERSYKVRVLARNTLKASAELGSAFEIVAGDLTKAHTLAPALRGIDHIIFTAVLQAAGTLRKSSSRRPITTGFWVRSTLRGAPLFAAASYISIRSASTRHL
jgi:uncharacterized protein YbjT (DUF2867 family)